MSLRVAFTGTLPSSLERFGDFTVSCGAQEVNVFGNLKIIRKKSEEITTIVVDSSNSGRDGLPDVTEVDLKIPILAAHHLYQKMLALKEEDQHFLNIRTMTSRIDQNESGAEEIERTYTERSGYFVDFE